MCCCQLVLIFLSIFFCYYEDLSSAFPPLGYRGDCTRWLLCVVHGWDGRCRVLDVGRENIAIREREKSNGGKGLKSPRGLIRLRMKRIVFLGGIFPGGRFCILTLLTHLSFLPIRHPTPTILIPTLIPQRPFPLPPIPNEAPLKMRVSRESTSPVK